MYSDSSQYVLNKTIQMLSKNNKFHILVHDTSGILSNEQLKLDMIYKVHFCDFCNTAKGTGKGISFCYKCKKLSLMKAAKVKDLYIGQCYLGITEIIKPVYYNDILLCVIYISNLITVDSLEAIKRKIIKRCKYTKAEPFALIDKLKDCEVFNPTSIEDYSDIIDILHHIILHCDIPYNTLNCKDLTPIPANNIKKHLLIEDIEKYLTANYTETITLKDLSKLYFIDEQYLCKLFKKETGVGFVDYINKIRIDNAKRLLLNSDATINSIAFQVGYSSLSSFNKIFKRFSGSTPKAYRKHSS
jgi:AraC-like DNA-binding protein/ligand-binding sensor protein